jgi:2-phospho-L-lactate/phosphoenolpyruvate guanylyltransferase
MTPGAPEWVVVVPVKLTALGKSRLGDVVADRAALALAIALDTIEAAAAASLVAEVIVVTDDREVMTGIKRMRRVRAVPEGTEPGLNAAIATGARAAGDDTARAALLGDLPALHPGDLDAALAAAATVERGLVTDAEGTGSTLVTARAGAVWTSAFGENSAERHRLLGCTVLVVPADSTLRRDVDTTEQLAAASALGLGPRTAAALPADVVTRATARP